MIHSPCVNCSDRILSCHSTCEKYIAFKEKRNRMNELIRLQKEREFVSIGLKGGLYNPT